MRTLLQERDGVFDVPIGAHLTKAIAEAIALSAKEGRPIAFVFNGVTITACADSHPEHLRRDYRRALEGCIIGMKVGPHPNPVLTDEERASDARIEAQNKAENEREWREQRAKHEAEARAKREAAKARLAEAPRIELAEGAKWPRSKATKTVTYAERWARLMQLEMLNGRDLENVAEATAHEANLEEITSFTYHRAVLMLGRYWKYGDRLWRWYTLRTRLGTRARKGQRERRRAQPSHS